MHICNTSWDSLSWLPRPLIEQLHSGMVCLAYDWLIYDWCLTKCVHVSPVVIGYHCSYLDGQLNRQAFTHCIIGRATKLSVVWSVICGMTHSSQSQCSKILWLAAWINSSVRLIMLLETCCCYKQWQNLKLCLLLSKSCCLCARVSCCEGWLWWFSLCFFLLLICSWSFHNQNKASICSALYST